MTRIFLVLALLLHGACEDHELVLSSHHLGQGGEWPAIAVGGTHNLHALSTTPLGDAFIAIGEFEAHATGGIEVFSTNPSYGDLVVRAVAPGGGTLSIDSEVVSGSQDFPTAAGHHVGFSPDLTTDPVTSTGGDWKLFKAGRRHTIRVSFYDDQNTQLIDDSGQLSATAPGVSFTPVPEPDSHNMMELDGIAGVDQVELLVDALSTTASQVVDVVDRIDAVTLAEPLDLPAQVEFGDRLLLCFRGVLDGVPVLGLNWTFAWNAEIQLVQSPPQNCVRAFFDHEGTWSVEAFAAGETVKLEFVVGAP